MENEKTTISKEEADASIPKDRIIHKEYTCEECGWEGMAGELGAIGCWTKAPFYCCPNCRSEELTYHE